MMRMGNRGLKGFTLIEMIIVIVILAIISASIAVFMAGPIRGYFQSADRAELSDTADTVLRRLARDVRLAVPNSVRVATPAGGSSYLEFVQTQGGGQYATNDDCFINTGTTTTSGCTSIKVFLNPLSNLSAVAVKDKALVIYNVNNNAAGDCGDDAPSIYCGHNVATISADPVDSSNDRTLTFARTLFHPSRGLTSPSQRFQIVDVPVTYFCDAPNLVNGNGTGVLRRNAGYGLTTAQTAFASGTGKPVATNLSACSISYAEGVTGSQGLLSIWLQLTRNGETVSLFRQIHVDNTP